MGTPITQQPNLWCRVWYKPHQIAAVWLCLVCVACISPREYGDQAERADGGRGGGTSGAYHPSGYAERLVHGIESNLQLEDCRDCHGADLTGGTSAVSCDQGGCHQSNWRTDCTLCHGGSDSPGGAPPREMAGVVPVTEMSFRAHTSHVTATNHAAWECTQCHKDVDKVLSPGHAFDDTPGKAEVTFMAGLSNGGQYDGNGGCANMYCHGNGRTTGASAHDDEEKTCASCHADQTVPLAWGTMSGEHGRHLADSVVCGDCHSSVADTSNNIIANDLHVNGAVEFVMEGTGITYSNGTCTGFCHNKGHFFDGW